MDLDPASTPGVRSRKEAERETDARGTELADLQERLYADSRVGTARSVLLILLALDTAGTGGIVRHVVGRLVDRVVDRLRDVRGPLLVDAYLRD